MSKTLLNRKEFLLSLKLVSLVLLEKYLGVQAGYKE
jgi:hypothetical protein